MTEYRMLEVGEVIQEGDEYQSRGMWWSTHNEGSAIDSDTVGKYRRPIEAKKGTGMFVEEVKTKKIRTVINGELSNAAKVSLQGPDDCRCIQLVVGADWLRRGSGWFNKESLTELIDNLTEVRDLMEGED